MSKSDFIHRRSTIIKSRPNLSYWVVLIVLIFSAHIAFIVPFLKPKVPNAGSNEILSSDLISIKLITPSLKSKTALETDRSIDPALTDIQRSKPVENPKIRTRIVKEDENTSNVLKQTLEPETGKNTQNSLNFPSSHGFSITSHTEQQLKPQKKVSLIGLNQSILECLETISFGKRAQPCVTPKPTFPEGMNTDGHCRVRFDITINGEVRNLNVTDCSHFLLISPTIRTVENWIYVPAIEENRRIIERDRALKVIYKKQPQDLVREQIFLGNKKLSVQDIFAQ